MFGVNWSDPQTLWLNLTNLALGVVTLAAVLVLVCGVGRELVLRRRKANALDAEMRAMAARGASIFYRSLVSA